MFPSSGRCVHQSVSNDLSIPKPYPLRRVVPVYGVLIASIITTCPLPFVVDRSIVVLPRGRRLSPVLLCASFLRALERFTVRLGQYFVWKV